MKRGPVAYRREGSSGRYFQPLVKSEKASKQNNILKMCHGSPRCYALAVNDPLPSSYVPPPPGPDYGQPPEHTLPSPSGGPSSAAHSLE
jgi:hypothetical protein